MSQLNNGIHCFANYAANSLCRLARNVTLCKYWVFSKIFSLSESEKKNLTHSHSLLFSLTLTHSHSHLQVYHTVVTSETLISQKWPCIRHRLLFCAVQWMQTAETRHCNISFTFITQWTVTYFKKKQFFGLLYYRFSLNEHWATWSICHFDVLILILIVINYQDLILILEGETI